MASGELGEHMETVLSLVEEVQRFARETVTVLHLNMVVMTVQDYHQTQPTVTPTTVQVRRMIFC